MKGLTVWRPFSDAIAKRVKPVENRTWPVPGRLLGQRIAIHAGKQYSEWALSSRFQMPGGYVAPPPNACPVGIVAVATLAGYLDTRGGRRIGGLGGEDSRVAELLSRLDDNAWWVGPVGWLLEDVVAIPAVACRGAQGLWTVPDDVERVVLAHEEEVRRAA